MSERIAGKTFYSSPEEAGAVPPTEEELAEARKQFAEFQKKVDAVAPEDRITNISPKFWDDIGGTEFDPRRK